MTLRRQLKIGITCYASVGGSGILATALGEDLARRGHEVHFISSERPHRLAEDAAHIHFHRVEIKDYELFVHPDYTLPLSVKMAEVSRNVGLDILHVHYAVPHATAAILAQSMLLQHERPRVVTTLHGTDTTLLAQDPAYAPAIKHALARSDAVTAVSHFLKAETERLLGTVHPIDVIHNFFSPRPARRTPAQVREELGMRDEALILHMSNLRPLKRIDLLLQTAALLKNRKFKLVILAGASFSPFVEDVRRLGLKDHVIVSEYVTDIEDYLHAADVSLVTSESESFCLSILEAMYCGCPSVATRVGGIPEVIDDGVTGTLVQFGDAAALAEAVDNFLMDGELRRAMAETGRIAAQSAIQR